MTFAQIGANAAIGIETARIVDKAAAVGKVPEGVIEVIGARRVLELSGVGVDDVDIVDLYSCFPSAVQVAARELGLSTDDSSRSLTITGGLTFAGGPWNNYVMHSIATRYRADVVMTEARCWKQELHAAV